MARALVPRLTLVLALLSWSGCKSTCDEPSTAYEWDEPGPWGFSAAEVFTPAEGTQGATIYWLGLFETEDLDEAEAVTNATIEIVFDKNSTAAGDVGEAKLRCSARLRVDATLTITTADGLLDDSFAVELESNGDGMAGSADLTDHGFAGALAGHTWTEGTLSLRVGLAADGSLDRAILLSTPRQLVKGGPVLGEGGFLAIIEPPS